MTIQICPNSIITINAEYMLLETKHHNYLRLLFWVKLFPAVSLFPHLKAQLPSYVYSYLNKEPSNIITLFMYVEYSLPSNKIIIIMIIS